MTARTPTLRKILLSPQQVAVRFILALATRPMTADVIADNLMRLGLKRHDREVLTSLAGLRGRGLCERRDAVGGGWEWWSDETIEDLEG